MSSTSFFLLSRWDESSTGGGLKLWQVKNCEGGAQNSFVATSDLHPSRRKVYYLKPLGAQYGHKQPQCAQTDGDPGWINTTVQRLKVCNLNCSYLKLNQLFVYELQPVVFVATNYPDISAPNLKLVNNGLIVECMAIIFVDIEVAVLSVVGIAKKYLHLQKLLEKYLEKRAFCMFLLVRKKNMDKIF